MKRICGLFIVLMISTVVFSQGDLENVRYFRVGYSQPAQKYLGINDASFWDNIERHGLSVEFGQIFILNSIPLADNLRLGINADYISFYYHYFKENTNKNLFFTLGSKVGPSLSYSPVEKLIFDTYIKINPVWVSSLISMNKGDIIEDEYDGFVGFFDMGYSFGINIRYSLLILGFDFNKSFNKLQHFEEMIGKFDGTYVGNASDPEKDKTPMPSFNFTIGMAF